MSFSLALPFIFYVMPGPSRGRYSCCSVGGVLASTEHRLPRHASISLLTRRIGPRLRGSFSFVRASGLCVFAFGSCIFNESPLRMGAEAVGLRGSAFPRSSLSYLEFWSIIILGAGPCNDAGDLHALNGHPLDSHMTVSHRGCREESGVEIWGRLGIAFLRRRRSIGCVNLH